MTRPHKPHSPRPRRQFKAWLISELAARGAQIPPDPSYQQLREALEPHLCACAPNREARA